MSQIESCNFCAKSPRELRFVNTNYEVAFNLMVESHNEGKLIPPVVFHVEQKITLLKKHYFVITLLKNNVYNLVIFC